ELLPSSSERLYLSRLLYNGFYCFEMITERSLDDVICGFCGVIGEFYLGDGNEKNCCSLKGIKYDVSNRNEDSNPMQLDDFLLKVKEMLKKIIFVSTGEDDLGDDGINASEIPPIIAPALRGKQVFNTEMKKKSIYLQNKPAQGDPALLHHLIVSKELDMASIDSFDLEQLKESAKKCNITLPSGASKSFIITEMHSLYASLLVGRSPCHGFSEVPGNTGGFYHFVCRHGFSVPEIIPLEYKSTDVALPKPEDLREWQHPITGNELRFVLGDRFHTATEPHKSPLCDYHDIKYCQQADTIKIFFDSVVPQCNPFQFISPIIILWISIIMSKLY
ncbi:hypothetical protein QZH41_010031, partial [Actinostola sp. cb2023]